MDWFALARILHIVAVVVWIGGVALVTTTVLPAVRAGEVGSDWLGAFRTIERRFIGQARVAVIIVGVTGFYMVVQADLWDRFGAAEFWWMHAMIFVWLVFALELFVAEPFILHRVFEKWAANRPDRTFAWLQAAHWFVLALSLLTIAGAVAGSHGWAVF